MCGRAPRKACLAPLVSSVHQGNPARKAQAADHVAYPIPACSVAIAMSTYSRTVISRHY